MSVADLKPKSSTALSSNYWFPLVAANATSCSCLGRKMSLSFQFSGTSLSFLMDFRFLA